MRIRVRASVTVILTLDVARTRTLTAGHQADRCCGAACDGGERNGLEEVGERTAGEGGGRIATISPPPPSGVRARVSKARRLTGDVAAARRACCCGTAGSPGVLALWRSRRSSAALYAARVAAGWPTWISESLGGSAFTMRLSGGLLVGVCGHTRNSRLNFSAPRKTSGRKSRTPRGYGRCGFLPDLSAERVSRCMHVLVRIDRARSVRLVVLQHIQSLRVA